MSFSVRGLEMLQCHLKKSETGMSACVCVPAYIHTFIGLPSYVRLPGLLPTYCTFAP